MFTLRDWSTAWDINGMNMMKQTSLILNLDHYEGTMKAILNMCIPASS